MQCVLGALIHQRQRCRCPVYKGFSRPIRGVPETIAYQPETAMPLLLDKSQE
jgi:hypothetical protein